MKINDYRGRYWIFALTLGLATTRADDLLDIGPPPIIEEKTVAGPEPAEPPRSFRPAGEIEELVPIPEANGGDRVIEVPSRVQPLRGLGERPDPEMTPLEGIQPVSVFVPTQNEQDKMFEDLERHIDQMVTIEWAGPSQTNIGQPFAYEIIVRNNSDVPAGNVIVRDRIPSAMQVISLAPKGVQDSEGCTWELGTLESREERRIKVEVVGAEKGDFTCQATVTATSTAKARCRVTRPELVLKRASASDKVLLGDPWFVRMNISNPGDGPAEGVTCRTVLSAGLRHERGNDFTLEIGTLAAGESRDIDLELMTLEGGNQTVDILATAAGELESLDSAATQVMSADLNVDFEGPSLRYLDRQAIYTVHLTNPGDAPAEEVKVTANVPPGFKLTACSVGGRHDFATSSLTWTVGTIAPGESRDFSYKATAVDAGEQKHVVDVKGARGLSKQAALETRVEGVSALLLEVVDVDDPVEVGSDTSYEIRVTNQGSRDATNVQIQALVPPEMIIRGGQGPTEFKVDGQELIFAPMPKLAPRADAIFRVMVTGNAKGDVRFRARLISDSLVEPVIEEESTKVYDD